MRKPDFIIGGPENPYLLRWYLIPQNRFFNVYLHKILRSDDDRARCTTILGGTSPSSSPAATSKCCRTIGSCGAAPGASCSAQRLLATG